MQCNSDYLIGRPSQSLYMAKVPRSLQRNYDTNPRTRTTIPLNTPVLKRLRPRTSRRCRLRSNLLSPRAVECPSGTWLAVHLPMSSARRIFRTWMQILLLPRDKNGVSARSHLLPLLNDRHQYPNRTLRELEAVNLIHMTMRLPADFQVKRRVHSRAFITLS